MPAATLRGLLEAAAALGIDRSWLSQEVGVPPVSMADLDSAVPRSVIRKVWAVLERAYPSPTLRGEMGRAVPFGAYGTLDYLVGSAGTVGEAMYALHEHLSLASSDATLDIEHHDHEIWVRVEDVAQADPLIEEFTLAVCLGRFAGVDGFSALWVGLRRPAQHARRFEAVFGAPLRFEHDTGMRLGESAWRAPMHSSDPRLHETLLALAKRLAPPPGQTTVARAVRARLHQAIEVEAHPGGLELDGVARSLGCSARTLQRRLSAAQLRFSELLDDVRKQAALRALEAQGESLVELSQRLGYADQSALSRAFRRWTGGTIREWMKRARQAPDDLGPARG